MATIVFQAAGAALGGIFGPVGAIIGQAAGALAGNAVDRALLSSGRTVSGARLSTARIPGADEGAAVNRLYGTARIGGTLIWATRFEESIEVERRGGKGNRGPKVETYRYFANLAIGLCEGEAAMVRRIWADGREVDLTGIEMRFYPGSETQLPDPLIEAKQGSGNAPAFRGLAYVVFERLPLDGYGNRIPLMQFEVVRPVGRLEKSIRAITVIPGATEHGYATVPVSERTGMGQSRIMNRNGLTAATDWQAAIDELQALCPNLQSVALVVSWFGTDMRAGECRILPGVEVAARDGETAPWSVGGLSRGEAHPVSHHGGGPAYGGTPDDESVLQAIADLKSRGLKVCLYPFVMMDVPAGNGLPDPYGKGEQDAYGWRGRITCFPAPGRPGSPDRNAAARREVERFCHRDEGYRRMVLHYAALTAKAGGVDAFLIGSELCGLTRLRDENDAFPFVEELVRLAGDVRAIMGPAVKLTYAADWSEYFGHQPADGSGDVFFHLDPLWASHDIDAIGIDNYMPLSDWRDEDVANGNPDGMTGPDDASAFRRAITAGEGFDWYYASDADRAARRRTPITDGLSKKPWVFRYKDIGNWWENLHYDRVRGVEKSTPTAWVPGSKPIWFTELGCPAVDKSAARPNVFPDPKSAENAYPYFSRRNRADSQQRRFLEAHLGHWDQGDAAMVDKNRVYLWTWDARPFPAFPLNGAVWSDGGNWRTGHWLNGRLGTATLADTIAAILTDHGFSAFDVSAVSGDMTGYVQGDVTSARNLLEPLMAAFQLDVAEDGGTLRFRSRNTAVLPVRDISVLADLDDEPLWSENRGHDSDFAAEAVLTSFNPTLDYEQASARSCRIDNAGSRVMRLDLNAALPAETAQAAVEAVLRDNRQARRTVRFALPPADITLEPGDCIRLLEDAFPQAPPGRFLVSRIEDGAVRQVEARAFSAALSASAGVADERRAGGANGAEGFAPEVLFLDLPYHDGVAPERSARIAAFARPWRPIVVSASSGTEGYRQRAVLDQPAMIGALAMPLLPGPSGRFDRKNTVLIDLPFGGLGSANELSVLNGENRIAIKAANGVWEIVAFAKAEEIAPKRWRLSVLLRGLAGTEDALVAGAPAGAPAVMLDAAVQPLGLAASERGRRLNWIVEAAGKAGASAGPFAFEGGLRAQMPLCPVHLSAERKKDGVLIRWKRRSRMEADGWDASDIPLDEPFERYRVEVLEGEAVKRVAEVSEPLWFYPVAAERTDFPVLRDHISVRVRQLGRAVPLGVAAQAFLPL
ncbi:glycoside hydrolase TIM-barrel-like domain-containing protein [Agrobacterium genomosp. 3]|uniref:baseplate multidomain protein megatron n=1 Tax=Agrobacterium tomkonis TaxID=1183410 RepID=UPI001CD854A2|nr:glycoside hydrolase TIM-barrel-like domain-containing protein [Agrobacterium tomkonis]MCA1876860.1 glycoside hydrolase TIM-barrel-like domain-containing protein [Agrobacterium tumefaciens]MCA1892642.1 glycoside hydrolase TIM-barrel-like domain-containing protein [Agrobacterium tomkonis]